VCRVYAYDSKLLLERGTFPGGPDSKLVAEKTYPDGAEYVWVVLAFAAPFLLAGAYRRVRSTQRAAR
jgi:hypothetical protein